MKRPPVLMLMVLGMGALAAGHWLDAPARFVWNRSQSAPVGMYWRDGNPPRPGDWVLVAPGSGMGKWAAQHGLTGRGWPLVKRVAAMAGDEVCRFGDQVFIEGTGVATVLAGTADGPPLPRWQGCVRLRTDEVFLLNPHPRSLDGRHFGPVAMADIQGRLVWLWGPS